MIIVGIDPGHSTGYAEWSPAGQALLSVTSMRIDIAMSVVLHHHVAGYLHSVVFEDARLRLWFGSKGRESLQGAGSIKRDCTIWVEFLGAHNIPYQSIAPQAGATKWTSKQFAKLTGWPGRTNEHGRDAAMLVFGRKTAG